MTEEDDVQAPQASSRPVWIWLGVFFAALVALSITTYVIAFGLDVQTVDTPTTSTTAPPSGDDR
ncbi:MAG: hypothetical protein ACI9MR_004915 [Myxococcota bacterium]|jgi:hypothetical protein